MSLYPIAIEKHVVKRKVGMPAAAHETNEIKIANQPIYLDELARMIKAISANGRNRTITFNASAQLIMRERSPQVGSQLFVVK